MRRLKTSTPPSKDRVRGHGRSTVGSVASMFACHSEGVTDCFCRCQQRRIDREAAMKLSLAVLPMFLIRLGRCIETVGDRRGARSLPFTLKRRPWMSRRSRFAWSGERTVLKAIYASIGTLPLRSAAIAGWPPFGLRLMIALDVSCPIGLKNLSSILPHVGRVASGLAQGIYSFGQAHVRSLPKVICG
jgi:hypothetical protein